MLPTSPQMRAGKMEYRRLGRTGLRVSLTSLGTGGPSQLGQTKGATPSDTRMLLRRALDRGINFIDTAADYGESETLLGHALQGVPRDTFILATKYTHVDDTGHLVNTKTVQASIDRSLKRLGLDYVDIMQAHGVAIDHYAEIVDTHLPVLEQNRRSGKIRYLGLTEKAHADTSHETFQAMAQDPHFDTCMVGYNLLHQTAERDVFKSATASNIGVIVMVAVRRALANHNRLCQTITDLKSRGLMEPDAVPNNDPLGWLIHGNIASIPEAAYRYVLEPPAVSTVLTGTANPEHLDANIEAMSRGPLPPADRDRLQALFGHLELGLGN